MVLKSESKGPKDQKLKDLLVRNWMTKRVKIGRSFRDKMDGSPENLQLNVGGLDFRSPKNIIFFVKIFYWYDLFEHYL